MSRLRHSSPSELAGIAVLLFAIVHAFWVAEEFAYTGYWDDTIAFASHARQAPSGFWATTQWVINQPGEFTGPYILGITTLLNSLGLLSNWLLILLSNLSIVALVISLYRASVYFGSNRTNSLVVSVSILFLPSLIDQRTWFLPAQHTLTALFALEAVVATHKLLTSQSWGHSKFRRAIWRFFLFDSLLLVLAFGREFGGLLSVFIILAILRTHRCRVAVIAVVAPWLLPVIVQVHRAISGRLGFQTERALDKLGVGFLADADGLGANVQPLSVVSGGLLLVIACQVLVLMKQKPRSDSYASRITNNSSRRSSVDRSLNFAVVALWTVSLLNPSISIHLVASVWPLGYLTDSKVLDRRWSYFEITPAFYGVALTLVFGLVLFCGSRLTKLTVLGTAAICWPFLLADVQHLTDRGSIASLSRYAPYFVAAGSCVTHTTLSVIRNIIKNRRTQRTQLLVVFSMTGLTLLPLLFVQRDLIVERTMSFRSLELETEDCEFRRFLITTSAGRRYLNFPFSKDFLPGVNDVLALDRRVQARYPSTEFEFDADASLEWKGSCLSKLELDDVLDDLLLQSQNDSRFESTIRELSIRVKTGDDDVLRKEVWKLISEMRTAGLVE